MDAGLIDEFSIALSPVLFGSQPMGGHDAGLERISPAVTSMINAWERPQIPSAGG